MEHDNLKTKPRLPKLMGPIVVTMVFTSGANHQNAYFILIDIRQPLTIFIMVFQSG